MIKLLRNGFLLLIATVFFYSMPAQAQKKSNVPALVGIWELGDADGGTGLLKIFDETGTMRNIGLGKTGMAITLEATYKANNTDSYEEKVLRTNDERLRNTVNTVRYAIKDNILTIQFSISGENYSETYRRVVVEETE